MSTPDGPDKAPAIIPLFPVHPRGGSMVLLADLIFSNEGAVAIGGLLLALTGAISAIFKLLISRYDKQIEDLKSERNSYKEMALESVAAMEAKVNNEREQQGKGPFPTIAAVVPEHSSPVTPTQQDTADLATLRARLTAATLALDLPARETGSAAPPISEEERIAAQVEQNRPHPD